MAEKFRWGILGIGLISRDFMIPALMESEICKVQAVASRGGVPEDYLPEVTHYSDYEELLGDPDVDAVYVPVPNALHARWAIRAMEHGKHVLCEKPVSCTEAEAVAMYRAAKENGVLLMEAFMYRSGSKFRTLCRILEEGRIGRIVSMQGNHGYPLTWKSPAREDRELGGGCLYDVGCYVVDCMNVLMAKAGAEPEKAAGCWKMKGGVDWNTAAAVQYSNGVTGSLACWFDGESEQRMLIVGEKGTVTVPNIFEPGEGTLYVCADGKTEEIPCPEEDDPYRKEAELFAQTVLSGGKLLVSPEDTLRNMRLLDMLHAGRPE